MTLNIRPVMVIARREIRDQFRDWRIIFPIVFLTIFFPFLMNYTAQRMLGFVQEYGATIVGERMVPFLLMIVGFFPTSTSLVIALESFVGEKERASIEPLLSSPIKDWQLYLGKLISSTVPPLVGSFLGMTVYLAGLVFSHVTIPTGELLLQIIVLTIVQTIVMVAGAVVVSSQATSVRAANLLASFIVIPVALLIQGESVVMFWGRDTLSLWWIILGLLVLAFLLVRVGLAHFQREELLGNELDVLNVRWMWRVFRQEFSGGLRLGVRWIQWAWRKTFQEMGWTILMVFAIAAAAVFIGAGQSTFFPLPLPEGSLSQRLEEVLQVLPLSSGQGVLLILMQNIRVLALGLVLGILTFGVLGTAPVLATMAISGYLVSILELNGISAWPVILGFFLPHGIIEIPAIVIASAAALQIGLLLATPNTGKTVGEVFIISIARWCRVMAAVVIPLLLLGAIIEATITPRIALLLF
jgi:uncharacterized membrane protein SpoIIM required for sporulation/ABC-type transport system involved in multi-copper enzyme maturation permease subunit